MLSLLSTNPYVPWDVDLFVKGALNLRDVIGVSFTVGIWIFFLISGVYLAIKIVGSIGN